MSASLSRQTVILVVEDEILLRFMTADSIRKAGYDVVEVGTAEEALPPSTSARLSILSSARCTFPVQ